MIAATELNKVVNCPGYKPLVDAGHAIYDDDRAARDEGILAAKIAETVLNGGTYPDDINDEMYSAVKTYADYVQTIHEPVKGYLLVESQLPNMPLGIVARPDALYFNRVDNTLHVFEFKYGHGFVDAFENWQLIGGAACSLYYTLCNDSTVIHMHIVQPRCFVAGGPIRRWVVTRAELQPYIDRIKSAVDLYHSDRVKTCIVGSHCYKCPVAHVCKSIAVASTYAVYDAYTTEQIEQLTDTQLALVLTQLETAQTVLKNRIDALKLDAEYRIKNGKRVPGYHIESGYGHAKWKYDDPTILNMGALIGADFSKPGVKTPAQCKKIPNIDPALIDEWSMREPTPPKLMTNRADSLAGLKWDTTNLEN